MSIQAQVINLLDDLQDELGLTYLFIAHDLGVVRHVSDRIAVMYLGKIVEISPAEELYERPVHPYTEALLSAVPIPDPDLSAPAGSRSCWKGDVPSPISPPSRLPVPPALPLRHGHLQDQKSRRWLSTAALGHLAACHHPLTMGPHAGLTGPSAALNLTPLPPARLRG